MTVASERKLGPAGRISLTRSVNISEQPASSRGGNWLRSVAVLVLYLVLAGLYTRPLLEKADSHIASDAGDPSLVATILSLNATTIPLSERWWNPPFFHLTHDVTAFTESFLGVSPVASPVYWMTGNPVTTYNVALFLTWPLSAFAVFLLVQFITERADAALLAGLAYGFTPYRISELGHLQMGSSYWMPLALLGLHGYVAERRVGWLVLFGVGWLLQSLANGYLMLFGAVLIGLWLLFFCSTRESWPAVPKILAAWGLASLPLVPILVKYRAVHDYYGLRRALDLPGLAVPPARSWFEVPHMVWLWGRVLPESGDNHFPGVTAVTIVLAGLFVALLKRGAVLRHRGLRAGLLLVTVGSVAAIVYTVLVGPWSTSIAGIPLKMTNTRRALTLVVLCGVPLLLTGSTREALRRRSPFVFYVGAMFAMGMFSIGPVVLSNNRVVLGLAPYRLLMYLPGFSEVRTPMRFWMLGVLCLGVAAGLAFARLPLSRRLRMAVFCVAVVGLLLDGWIRAMPMAAAPTPWPEVEPPGVVSEGSRVQPILELPLGPDWDAAATLRSLWHRRPVFNGVSGYDPSYYDPLQAGLNALDPEMILALASFGSFDAVVNGPADPGGTWATYVSSVPGVVPIASDGIRTAYRVPAADPPDEAMGDVLPIADLQGFVPETELARDGRLETWWGNDRQRPGQWLSADLGSVREVGGVTIALGEYARDFPRLLAIDVSLDGVIWHQVWQGPTVARAFRAAVLGPREAAMPFTFAERPARFVRLQQLAEHRNLWRVAELKIHGPRQMRGVSRP